MHVNTGKGLSLSIIEIGLKEYVGILEPDLAFWSLLPREDLSTPGCLEKLAKKINGKRKQFSQEMDNLRFGLTPSAVYFNPTDACNLDCTYCYLPSSLRRDGKNISSANLSKALKSLRSYFRESLPEDVKPQLVFHGSEPLIARDAVFKAIEEFEEDFSFGVQTNAVLFDRRAADFLTSHKVGIGISLDGPTAAVADISRKGWSGKGVYNKVIEALDLLDGYPHLNVICTVTSENVHHQKAMVELMHKRRVPVGMLNYVRCTREGGNRIKADNNELAKHFIKALDRSYELYQTTGRKLIIANFANILLSLVAPAARRLMCDISPCGGGRAFMAVSAQGNVFPCSEFIGMPEFCGGNIFKEDISKIISSPQFKRVTTRVVEDITPCRNCAIRHFCGAPCPAELHGLHNRLDVPTPYCEFLEEQVRYALRLLVLERHEAYLYDDWKKDTKL
ncbi:MAG: peptide-modifying radical SAM enzyme CbpB, partial [Candidatus Scalindua sp.]